MIDHQTGLLVSCRDQDPHLMTQNIKGLCSLAKTVGMPSIITASMPDGPNGPIMTEITDILGDDIIERAGEINAWKSPEFKQAIKATGRKKIIMAGIVTDVCLLFPAISAVAEGYDVYAVVDASGTWNKAVTDAAMHRMTQAGVKVVTWASVLVEVMDDWRSEHGIALGGVLGEHTSYRWVYNSFLQASGQN
ncbi:isochorismatase family protein [Pseudoalteromonas sp. SR43-7]|uniref:isochorismatase family protein n=1 Tax=Pseudoalteromonas sp. SR43-7 TaxID=2760939 RepID=UPI0021759E0B|nr:isochorismatase family protein [Pseudoalteromonas sp. SR43-7]